MPTLYDITTDNRRVVTQEDVDLLAQCAAAFGLLVIFLRKSSDRAYRDAADTAVHVAQGKISPTDGSRDLDMLRRDML